VSSRGPATATASADRGGDPWKLSVPLCGELDWIVVKALEKDRDRRYESAGAFAADVERYLRDDPVEVCPPSNWYRVRKAARRNRRPLAAGPVGLALVAGVVETAVSLVEARPRPPTPGGRSGRRGSPRRKRRPSWSSSRSGSCRRPGQRARGRGSGATPPSWRRTPRSRGSPRRSSGNCWPKPRSAACRPDLLARRRLRQGGRPTRAGAGPAVRPPGSGPPGDVGCAAQPGLRIPGFGLAEALAPLGETLRRHTARPWPDHHNTLIIASNLACLYRDTDRPDDALALFRDTLGRYQRAGFAADHPARLTVMNQTGDCRVKLKRYDEAGALLRDCLAPRTRVDAGSWWVARTRGPLGQVAAGLEQYSEAEALLLDAPRGCRRPARSRSAAPWR
jgi:hypothetical protein